MRWDSCNLSARTVAEHLIPDAEDDEPEGMEHASHAGRFLRTDAARHSSGIVFDRAGHRLLASALIGRRWPLGCATARSLTSRSDLPVACAHIWRRLMTHVQDATASIGADGEDGSRS